MSLILDALNKADRERDQNKPVPSLDTYHSAPKLKSQARKFPAIPLWSIFASLFLVFLGLVAVFVMVVIDRQALRQTLESSLGPIPETQFQASFNPEGELVARDSRPEALQSNTTGRDSSQIKTATELPIKPRSSYEESLPTMAAELENDVKDQVLPASIAAIYENLAEPNQNIPSANRSVDRLYSNSNTKPAQSDNTTAITEKSQADLPLSTENIQRLWRESDSQPSPSNAADGAIANIPFLYQLPESFKNRIPTLLYQNHIYSAKGGAVVINGETYRKGSSIAQDLLIEEITEEELVLSYLKKPFKLTALSSWVNGN
jgi:general secretion pathway protein B